MKFGKLNNPGEKCITKPPDHLGTRNLLNIYKKVDKPRLYVGFAKWNRADRKEFYPCETKDELAYYSTQFNNIKLKATFYRIFPVDVFTGL